jgi:hypothetical protein
MPLHVVYSEKDLLQPSEPIHFCGVDDPQVIFNVSEKDFDEASSITTRNGENDWAYVNLLFVTDNEFYTLESDWIACAQDYLGDANYQFQRQDIKVVLYGSFDASQRRYFDDHTDYDIDPLVVVESLYSRDYLNNARYDICVYLGGNDILGTAQGMAHYVNRYTWSQMVDGADTIDFYDGSRHSRIYCLIHELGHSFNSRHEQAMRYKNPNREYKYTVMYGSYMGSFADWQFSPPAVYVNTGPDMFIGDNAQLIREKKHVVSNHA